MKPRSDPPETTTAERRVARRVASQSQIKLTLDTLEITGTAENLSQTGALFYSEGVLRVTVEIDDNGQRTTRRGRLVRAQRMRAEQMGWAIEFD